MTFRASEPNPDEAYQITELSKGEVKGLAYLLNLGPHVESYRVFIAKRDRDSLERLRVRLLAALFGEQDTV